MSPALEDAPVCGCLGCVQPAEYVVNHPEHGRRAVCPSCADTMEVVGGV